MASIPLNHGMSALIDDEDYALIASHKWWYNTNGYAYTTKRIDGKNKNTMMHHMIMPRTKGLCVDHVNGNTLDNRHANLRLVTHAQNLQNRHGATRASASGVRNVYFHPGKRKYQVKLQLGNRQKSCGYYRTIEEATIAAAEARRKYMTHASE